MSALAYLVVVGVLGTVATTIIGLLRDSILFRWSVAPFVAFFAVMAAFSAVGLYTRRDRRLRAARSQRHQSYP